jgi:hypothetical protein
MSDTDQSQTTGIHDPKYRERARLQALAWAQGRAYHDTMNDECCPDFSCCHPDLFQQDAAERWTYYHRKYGARN